MAPQEPAASSAARAPGGNAIAVGSGTATSNETGPAPWSRRALQLRRRGSSAARTDDTDAADSSAASEEGSDAGADEPGADLYGSLKGLLVWDAQTRRLHIGVRQYAESARKLELKVKGSLDTVSGQHRLAGHVRKDFYTHVPLLQRLLVAAAQRQAGRRLDEPRLDPDAWLPGGLRCMLFQDWTIAPGIGYDTARGSGASGRPLAAYTHAPAAAAGQAAAAAGQAGPSSQRLRYQLAVKKNPQVIRTSPKLDIWAYAKGLAEFEPRTSEVSLQGGLRLKLLKYGLTPSQDLKLTLGLDWAQAGSGAVKRTPYIHIGDNKLGARLQYGRWQLLYGLQ